MLETGLLYGSHWKNGFFIIYKRAGEERMTEIVETML